MTPSCTSPGDVCRHAQYSTGFIVGCEYMKLCHRQNDDCAMSPRQNIGSQANEISFDACYVIIDLIRVKRLV